MLVEIVYLQRKEVIKNLYHDGLNMLKKQRRLPYFGTSCGSRMVVPLVGLWLKSGVEPVINIIML